MTVEQAVQAALTQAGCPNADIVTLNVFHILRGHHWRPMPPPPTPAHGTPAPPDLLAEVRQRLERINAERAEP